MTILIREFVLIADRTYYVRTDGSDSHTGLSNTAGGAFLTIQKAIDTAALYYWAGYQCTIQVGPGTWTAAIALRNLSGIGSGPPIIIGDETTPANVIVSRSGNCFSLDGIGTLWNIRGFRIASSANAAIFADRGSRFAWQNCEFGTSGYHIDARYGVVASSTGPYKIIGNAFYHYRLSAARLLIGAGTITLTGTPAWGGHLCYLEDGSSLNCNGGSVTFSGAATGARYNVQSNSVANTNGAGASYFPGNAVGATSTGGVYL